MTTKPENHPEPAEPLQQTTQELTSATPEELADVNRLAEQMIDRLADLPDGDQVGQIIANAMKLMRDRTNRGDIKLINQSFKEIRYALKIFVPYRDVKKVSIFGSARTPETHGDYQQASDFAKKMAADGWMVITGAGGGIMTAGHGGAGAEPSFGLAIRLPHEQFTNRFIANDPKLVHFKYFFTRKLMFVRSSHAVALFPGGFGTMDEGFEVLTLIQTGKSTPVPIVLVDTPGGDFWKGWQDYVKSQLLARGLISPEDLHLYKITDSIDEAVAEIRGFYNNYHSMRYSRDRAIIRLTRPPTAAQLAHINATFSDLLVTGKFETGPALPIEHDEPSLADLPRLIFAFNRRDHGRLRMLIDYLNSP